MHIWQHACEDQEMIKCFNDRLTVHLWLKIPEIFMNKNPEINTF